MPTVLCTLFNHYYLDKGLVLYDSLVEVSNDFRLYILCMDDRCYEILEDLNYPEIIPIKLSDFEDEEMLIAKGNRTFGEYCWTCSSSFILYVLEKYKEPICTYIDADMYFFQDPQVLINEMIDAGKSVMITPHRFSPISMHKIVNGEFCVEFNTFVNVPDSINVLRKWKEDCLDCCTAVNDGIHFGDQKYLDSWPSDYSDVVHVCQNPGAGVAPWNLEWYKLCNKNNHSVFYDNHETPIVFYHFQEIKYLTRELILTGVRSSLYTIDYGLVDFLYRNYLTKIEKKKQMLESKYKIYYIIKSHPAKRLKRNWKYCLRQIPLIKKLLWLINPARFKYQGMYPIELKKYIV